MQTGHQIGEFQFRKCILNCRFQTLTIAFDLLITLFYVFLLKLTELKCSGRLKICNTEKKRVKK